MTYDVTISVLFLIKDCKYLYFFKLTLNTFVSSLCAGGYLSWKNHPIDEDTEDRSEFSERAPSLHQICQTGKHQHKGHANGYQRNATRKDRNAEIF